MPIYFPGRIGAKLDMSTFCQEEKITKEKDARPFCQKAKGQGTYFLSWPIT